MVPRAARRWLLLLSAVMSVAYPRDAGAAGPTGPEQELKGIARTTLDSPRPTAEQLARRARSLASLQELGLLANASLPVVEDQASFRECSPEEIVKRHRALNRLIRYLGQDWDDVTTDT